MHNFKISEHLQNLLAKLSKKDKSLHEQVLKKISEVVASANVEHYKNLRYDMKESKRVHIGHFITPLLSRSQSAATCFPEAC